MLISELLTKELKKVSGKSLSRAESRDFSVMLSQRPEFGDYTTNLAFVLAKERGQSPFLVAEDLKKELEPKLKKYFSKIEVKNGYLNFFVNPQFILENLNQDPKKILKQPKQKTVVVDYSSPNMGKQLSIAHLRSTVVGDALARIFEFCGWKVIGDNHLGDWGMMAGKLIFAYKKYSKTPLVKVSIQEMQELYVKFTTAEKEDTTLTDLAKAETVKLQKHDKENLKIWNMLLKNSIKEFKKYYQKLNIRKFDYWHGESFYQEIAEKLVKDFEKKGWAVQSQGALMVELENRPAVIIKKADEAFLYATSDLATIIYRTKELKPDLSLYVVANEQAFHFEQLFLVAKKLNLAPKTEMVHVKFGMMLGQDRKKLSTRSGKSIMLDDVLNEATQKAKDLALAKNTKLPLIELEKVSQKIAVGAIKYNDLSQNRLTDVVFDWQKMLSLEGNSSPYIQYAYARLFNVLTKSGLKKFQIKQEDFVVFSEEERSLLRKVLMFPEAVEQARKELMPNLVANYVYELASQANTFYEKFPVLTAEAKEKQARLALINLVCQTIKTGLGLFGIEVFEKI